MIDERRSQTPRVHVSGAWRGSLGGVALVAALVAGLAVALDAAGIVGQGPPVSPAPVAALDAAALRAAIDAESAGGLEPRDVIADVSIDRSRRTPPLDRECVPLGHCAVIGTLTGFDDPAGTVTLRAQDQELPPPTEATDLAAPVALRLSGSGPIEFLGRVRLAADGLAFDVPSALAATGSAPAGEVIAVTGWLVGVGPGFSCGPAPMPGPPIPAPFVCHVPEFITARPTRPVSGGGNSFEMSAPAGSVQVQRGAYDEYAPRPSFDGVNDVPRLGTYLLRMVVDDASNCPGCRGWLVVGRLDATAAPASPQPSGYRPERASRSCCPRR